MNPDQVTIDFVARGDCPGQWKLVIVEEGPWAGSTADELRRIQGRLYGCLDAAVDGQLAASFPDSLGGHIVIQLDCYKVPRGDVESFFRRFSEGVLSTDDYRVAIQHGQFVSGVSFEINFG